MTSCCVHVVRWFAALCVAIVAAVGSDDSEGMGVDVDSSGDMSYPSAPSDLATLFEWAPQMLEQLDRHQLGPHIRTNLLEAFSQGVTVVTDYSGYGSPELALHSLSEALGFPSTSVNLWRASDIMPDRRRMLLAGSPDVSPQHVFGDILHRVSTGTRKSLLQVKKQADQQYAEAIRAGAKKRFRCKFCSTVPPIELVKKGYIASVANSSANWISKNK